MLPFPDLARIKKGVFGLSDAPRPWYLRLNRSLVASGWERTSIDYACWLLWSPDRKSLDGAILSHVDDLLLGGNWRAKQKLLDLGKELGFGAISEGDFTYCGKRIRQHEDGRITISMVEYHGNLKQIHIPMHRRKMPDAELSDGERRQLRAALGSLQWLVAQLRFDLGYQLSVLQGETPRVGTLMKTNLLIKKFKQKPDFALTFFPMDIKAAGVVVVTDASLGNVTKQGSGEGAVMEKVYSQSAYFVLLGEESLLSGQEGRFSVLDARSHRLQRVCRSTYGAELMGCEEGMDMGTYIRGWVAMFRGLPMEHRFVDAAITVVPMAMVVDAKDVFDKGNADTPTYGAQKSLAFTVSWMRGVLSRPNTTLKWTSTDNMFVDVGTKEMDYDHLHRILAAGKWSIVFNQDYIKQKSKAAAVTKAADRAVVSLIGEALGENHPMCPYFSHTDATVLS